MQKLVSRAGGWLLLAAAVAVCSTVPHAAAPQQPAQPAGAANTQYQALMTRYCVSCHNDRLKTGSLSLEKIDLGNLPSHTDVWEKVIRKLDSGTMPPQGQARPDQATTDGFVTWLKTTLDRDAAARPNPGRALLRRLNRVEYANAIRDLLALDLDVASLLPPDDSSYGFDNIADILGSSPVLLESYVNAATEISAIAVGSIDAATASSATYTAPSDTTQIEHVEGLPLGTRGGLLIHHTFPLDGEYLFKIKLWRNNSSSIRGLSQPHDVEITIDGERIFVNTIGTPEDYVALITNPGDAEARIDPRLQIRVPVKAGPHNVGVSFVFKSDAPNETLLRPLLASHDPISIDGVPRIDSLLIGGPFKPTGPGDTPSRRRIFSCRPGATATGAAGGAVSEAVCSRRIITTLARRAYRRPVTAADLQPLVEFYNRGRKGGDFDAGIGLAIRRMLIDPAFLFRAEVDPAGLAAGSVARLNSIDLASRLSFFLWSSIPDDRLLAAGIDGTLNDPAVLERQVRRMLADPKAKALGANFAGQWLFLRNLQQSRPDTQEFPDFDDSLRQGFRQETEMLFQNVQREDRSVMELLTADYTFVNERLARHYGIPGVYGSQFRRVAVTDDARRGILGHGSILTVTSMPNRTSPVRRGKWILENLLGSPPPPPPPNVPPLKDQGASDKPKTMREQMEEHRANPVCANCHRLMDPLGFAMENFNGVGAWRTKDGATPIDASSQLADGTKVNGVVTLRQALTRRPERFVGTMTEKLMTYALGRGLVASDMPAVRKIVGAAAANNYRFSSIVLGIVNSVPFKMRMKPGPESVSPAATTVAAR